MEPSFNHPQGPPPENNLIWAILCTVLCCLSFGIVSIIKSTKVKELWMYGDYIGAQKAADDAKKWAIWGAVAAIIGWVLYLGLFLFIGFLGFIDA